MIFQVFHHYKFHLEPVLFALSSVSLNTYFASTEENRPKKGLSLWMNLTKTTCYIFHFETKTIQHIVFAYTYTIYVYIIIYVFYSLSMKIFEKFSDAENTNQAIKWMNKTKRMNVISICCQQFKHRKEKPIEIFIRPLLFTRNFLESPPVAASLCENHFVFIFYVSIVAVDGDHCRFEWDACEYKIVLFTKCQNRTINSIYYSNDGRFRKKRLGRTRVENKKNNNQSSEYKYSLWTGNGGTMFEY